MRRDARGAGRRASPTSSTTPAPSPPTASPTSSGRRCGARSPRGCRSSPAAPASGRPSAPRRSSSRRRRRTRGSRSAPRRAGPRGASRRRPATPPRRSTGCSTGCRARSPGHHAGHPHAADVVLVDEASMLNLQICEVLLAGLAETTHIVLVGDADQLPPVGAGKPFGDLIAADIAPITRLTHVFRQAARSMIITAAHAVNEGRDPDLEPGPDQERDFFFMDRPNPAHAVEAVTSLVAERVPDGLGLDPVRDVQVLAPMYKTPVGIDALNAALQAAPEPQRRARRQGPLPRRRPPDPDPQLARARPDERLDLLPRRGRPRRGGRRRRDRRRRDDDRPLRRDPLAAPRLRDLGPQVPGLRGPGRGLRLPPLPLADADPPADLHGDHARQEHLRPGRRAPRPGPGRAPRRRRPPPLGAGRAAAAGVVERATAKR